MCVNRHAQPRPAAMEAAAAVARVEARVVASLRAAVAPEPVTAVGERATVSHSAAVAWRLEAVDRAR